MSHVAAYLMRGPAAAPRWLYTNPVGFAALWLAWIGLACLTWGGNLLLPILADRRTLLAARADRGESPAVTAAWIGAALLTMAAIGTFCTAAVNAPGW